MSDVASYERQGDDLVLLLMNGEKIVLADFFRADADGQPMLALVSRDGDCFVEVRFVDDVHGLLEPIIGTGACDAGVAVLPLPLLLAGLLAGVAGIAAASSSGGDGEDGDDGNGGNGGNGLGTLPKPEVDPTGGKTIKGTGEAGKIVEIDTDGDGTADQSTIIDEDGNWSIDIDPDVEDGEEITVIVTDPEGNTSDPVIVIVDGVAPAAPLIDPTDGKVITGTAEPGAVIAVDLNGDGVADLTTTANEKGQWSVDPQPDLVDGTQVTATATDAAGNVSAPSTVTVDTSIVRPPVVDPTNGKAIQGTGEPGTKIEIDTDGDGEPEQTVDVGPDGRWSADLEPDVKDGEEIEVTAVKDGKESEPVVVVVDAVAPEAPEVEPTDGKVIEGTGEPGTRIEVDTNGDGDPEYTTTVDERGRWIVDPQPDIAAGTEIEVVAVDDTGNESQPTIVTVETVPAPQINPTNGSLISGTSLPLALIKVDIDDDGTVDYSTIASQNGNWSVTPASKLPHETKVTATATTKGLTSEEALEIVDGKAPDAPHIDPTSGKLITGTAEPLSRIDVDVDGDGIADYTARTDEEGRWSVDPHPDLKTGDKVTATATDAAGNTSGPTTVTIDTSQVAAPVVEPTNGKAIEGTAQPGDLVMVDIDEDGTAEYSDIADARGNWRINFEPDLADKEDVTVWAENENGKSADVIVVVDAVRPDTPVIDPTDGTVITGTAEPGATVKVDVTGDGIADYTAVAGADGKWSVDPSPDVVQGEEVTATATDGAGNTSDPASVIVGGGGSGGTVPAPDIDPTNGTVVTGTAAPNAQVEVDLGAQGKQTVAVNSDGTWTVTPVPPLADGTVVTAVTIQNGKRSAPDTETVDAVAPPQPEIDPTNGMVITGTADGDAVQVELYFVSGGKQIVQVVNGQWSYTPATRLADGTEVKAVSLDAAGNRSTADTETVDAVAPPAPSINPTNGTIITGTADGDAVQVELDLGAGGKQIVQVVDGKWSYAPATQLADGTLVKAISLDAVGNRSLEDTEPVDFNAVPMPQINPTNGKIVSGTAEPNTEVEVDLGAQGKQIVTVDGAGTWSLTPASPLANGFEVKAVTIKGGMRSLPDTEIVDTSVPPAPVIDEVSEDSGVVGDHITNDSTLVIKGTADAGATVKIHIDGVEQPGTATADAQGNWSYGPTSSLADKVDYKLTATQINPQGTESPASAEYLITIDTNGGGETPNAAPPPFFRGISDDTGSGSNDGATSVLAQKFLGTADPHATVELYVDGNFVGTTKADANGEWVYDYTNHPFEIDTRHEAYARQIDTAGNPKSEPSNTFFMIFTNNVSGQGQIMAFDAAVPEASGQGEEMRVLMADEARMDASEAKAMAGPFPKPEITGVTPDTGTPGDGVTNTGAIKITGKAEPGEVVTLYDDDVAIGSTTANGAGDWELDFTTNPLTAGSYDLIAVILDANDVAVSPYSDTVPLNIVTAVPDAPTIEAISDDTGTPGDGVTTDRQLIISGKADAGATVEVYLNGNKQPGTATADGQGNWSYDTGTLASDLYEATAVQTNQAGTASLPSAPFDILIEPATGVAPDVTAISPDTNIAGDGITSEGKLVIEGTASANVKVRVIIGTDVVGTAQADANGNWSLDNTGNTIADGTYKVRAQEIDSSGFGTSPYSDSFLLTVDTLAPDAPTVDAIDPDTGIPGDGITNNNRLVFKGTAEANASIEVYLDGNKLPGTVMADANGDWSYDHTGTETSEGPHNVTARAIDQAGTVSPESAAYPIVVDTMVDAPRVTGITEDRGISATDGITNDDRLVFSGTGEEGATLEVFLDGVKLPGTVTVGAGGVWSYDHTGTDIPDGTHQVTARQTDGAGNVSAQSAPFDILIDTAVPLLAPQVTGISPDTDTPGDGKTTNPRLIISGTAEKGASVKVYIDGNPLPGTVIADGNGDWSYDHTGTQLSLGGHDIAAEQTDAAGNGPSPLSPDYPIEILPPPLDANDDTFTFQESVLITGTDLDVLANDTLSTGSNIVSVEFVDANGTALGTTYTLGSATYTISVNGNGQSLRLKADGEDGNTVPDTMRVRYTLQDPNGTTSTQRQPSTRSTTWRPTPSRSPRTMSSRSPKAC